MNKKFSTLIACVAMLFAAFTVNAQINPALHKDKFAFLKTADGDYLQISKAKPDSVIVGEKGTTKAAMDYALWSMKGTTTAAGTSYTITNKATGAVLSFATTVATPPVMKLAEGADNWGITGTVNTSPNALVGLFKHGTTTDNAWGLKVIPNAITTEPELTIGATPTAWISEAPTTMILNAQDLGSGSSIFSLTFGETYTKNIFAGKELIAKDSIVNGAKTGWVYVQEYGAEKAGTRDMYFMLDTTRTSIDAQQNVYGANFAKDSIRTSTGSEHATGAAADSLALFQFKLDPATDNVTIYVKNAPVFANDGKFSKALWGDTVMVVRSSTDGTRVLTVAGITNDVPLQGAKPSIKLTKGTPSKLDTGDGVYFIKTKKADGKWYYLYADPDNQDPIDNPYGMDLDKTVPSAYQPAGQWYVKGNEDGYYAIAERNYNWYLGYPDDAQYIPLYAVTGSNPQAYRIDGSDLEFVFEYQEDITAGGVHYLATNYFDPAQFANYAYTLNLKSGTSGVQDLYTFIDKDAQLIIKGQTTATDAAKFKIAPAYNDTVYTIPGATDGLGALQLGDTLAVAGYYLYQQYTNKYVTFGDNDQLVLDNMTPPATFTFNSTSQADKYLMYANDDNIILNVETGTLIENQSTTNVNYFNLEKEAAPDYASFEKGHYNIESAEDDGKMLSMNPDTFFGEIKFPGQVISKADTYIDSLFGLYITPADAKDEARPTYYVATQNTLSADDKAEGIMYFLANPFGFLSYANDVDAENFDDLIAKYMFSPLATRATFVKGATDADTLQVFAMDLTVDKDTLLKDITVSPAAIAFATTANGSLNLENEVELGLYASITEKCYLRVVNNTLVWIEGGYDLYNNGYAHNFLVKGTDVFPTDNENPEAGFQVYGVQGGIIIQGAADQVVSITNVLGQTIAKKTIGSSYETISAPAGVVFVTINGETVKALVK